jgi:hypothetical protein
VTVGRARRRRNMRGVVGFWSIVFRRFFFGVQLITDMYSFVI